jgi:TPR repeat protein
MIGSARPDCGRGSQSALLRSLSLAALVLIAAVALSAFARPVDDAAAAYQRGDYATAARLYHGLADQGDANAQNSLGVMYLRGQGAKQDNGEAMKWFRRAAALGSPEAQFNLAEMYFKGRGVDQDPLTAAKWYSRAAEQGLGQAQFTLGALYLIGVGVPENSQKAAYWFERAAAQGHAEAQKELGKMYGAGHGVPKDLVSAYKWLALSRANARNDTTRTSASRSLQGVAGKMTPAQIAQAQRLASEWRATPSKVAQR